MGHGTAVPEHFDIDLVLYSSGEYIYTGLAICLSLHHLINNKLLNAI